MELAGEAFVAKLGERSVVLDLVRDKYILLGTRLTSLVFDGAKVSEFAFAGETSTGVGEGITKVIADLPGKLEAAPTIPLPDSTIWPTKRNGLGLGRSCYKTVSALRALADVQRSLSRRPFQQTIEFLHNAKWHRTPFRGDVTDQDLLDAFHAARPWFWIEPICRLDALALCLYFWRNGRKADLIFGVRLEPFAAHCWAQTSEGVLNEPRQNLEQYTQIMRV